MAGRLRSSAALMVAVCLVASGCSLFKRSRDVHGRLVHEWTRVGIAGASLTLDCTRSGGPKLLTTTGADGSFRFASVAPAACTLVSTAKIRDGWRGQTASNSPGWASDSFDLGRLETDETEWAHATLSAPCESAFTSPESAQPLPELQRTAILEAEPDGKAPWRRSVRVEDALRRELQYQKRELPSTWKVICLKLSSRGDARYSSSRDRVGFSVTRESWTAVPLGPDGRGIGRQSVGSVPTTLASETAYDPHTSVAKDLAYWATGIRR